jgi:hypothetical protein
MFLLAPRPIAITLFLSKYTHLVSHVVAYRPLARLDQESKNPAAPAVKREAEEDWGREKRR